MTSRSILLFNGVFNDLYKNYASDFYFKPYLLYESRWCILPTHYVKKIFFSVNHAHSL